MPELIHKDIKSLISRMLVVEPQERITIPEIKQHLMLMSSKGTIKSKFLEPPENDFCFPLTLSKVSKQTNNKQTNKQANQPTNQPTNKHLNVHLKCNSIPSEF